jgi:hypothetical protein
VAAALILLLCSCQTAPDRDRHGLVDEFDRPQKSVLIGELLAIFPGLLWHGLGHRYAGDIKKAEEIELMEAYGIVAGGAGTGLVFAGRSDDDLIGLEITGWSVGGVGALLFVGSWLYDIIYTPSAVHRYNTGMLDD